MKNESSSLTSSQGESVVLRSVHAHGRLEGLLMSMTLRQVFRNDQSKTLEVTYTFPLAWGAVLLGLEATIGEKRMTGLVMARREARERYEEAIEKGDAPIMVEKAQGGVFSASLGSLKPGEEAVVEITYAQLLSFEQDRIRLVVPTTIAPRYGDAVKQAGLQPDQVEAPDLLAEHRFDLSMTITGSLAQARIGSPTHSVTQQRHQATGVDAGVEAGVQAVTVSLQAQAWLDRDFVLLLEGLEGRSFAIAGPDNRSGERHQALIASYCPALPTALPAPLRLKILVDCSGSMTGQSIGQARDALRPLAAHLTQQDQVSYTRFGDRAQRVLSAADATPRNVQALINAINETDADLGGTEMADALQDTFSLRMGAAQHTEEADVLIITDGEVWDAQNIVDNARRSGHRIYALGVGSAPAESLLREMTESTGGACEFATPHEDMAAAVQRLLARVRQALPIQAHVEMTGKPLWMNPLPRRLAASETVHLFMRLPAKVERAPALQLAGQNAVLAELSLRDDDLVARLVAAREIGALTDRTQARELAERYQLVTEETNLLLVIERAEADKTDGMPALHKVQPMLAAGWGGTGNVVQASSVRFSHRAAPSLQVQRSGTDNVPFDPYSGAVLSVWRTTRTPAAAKVDALASGGMDDFEIPAFLRKLTDENVTSAATSSASKAGVPAPGSQRAKPATATARQLIEAFNRAAAQGLAFRPTLRAVTDLPLEDWLCQMIVSVSKYAGGPVKAWACYLRWLHEHSAHELQLTPEAMALVEGQVKNMEANAHTIIAQAFEKQSATA
jgi:Ca-activated chloride channel family protein